MDSRSTALTIITMLLLTSVVSAQIPLLPENGGDQNDESQREECEADRDADYAEAEEEYQEDIADAEEEDYAEEREEERQEAEKEYQENIADADQEYEECMAGVEEDHADCESELEEEYAEAEEEYQEDIADAEEEDYAEEREAERQEAEQDYQESYAKADQDYEECMEETYGEDWNKTADSRRPPEDHGNTNSTTYDENEEDEMPESYDGRYVSFNVSRHGIRAYVVDENLIFASVAIEGPAVWKNLGIDGASIKMEGEDIEVKASDTPTGVLRFGTEDRRVFITFGDDVDVRPNNRTTDRETEDHQLIIGNDRFEALLFLTEEYEPTDRGIVTAGKIRLVVVETPELRSEDSTTVQGIADGRIAVEVDVSQDGDIFGAEHGDIQVDLHNEKDGIIAVVNGEGEGKTVLFNLKPELLNGVDDLIVTFDGAPIGLADSVEDVMDVSDGVAEYLIILGAEETKILVQVPHFSTHTIKLSGAGFAGATDLVSYPALGVGGAVASLFIAVTLISRRLRD